MPKEAGNENAVAGPKLLSQKASGPASTLGPIKVVAKAFRSEPTVLARGPLAELGNKNLSLKPASKVEQISKKVNGTLKDNLPVIRNKSKENVVVKPAQTSKSQQAAVKPTTFKRQESILSKLVKPLSNFNVKDEKPLRYDNDCNKAVVPTAYSSKQLVDIIDVDEKDDDPHYVSTYVKEIMRYLLELEKRYAITENYLLNLYDDVKHSTSNRMRSVLVNWMVEVHSSFGFLPETLHLSVAITDRYLQKMPSIGNKTLQLVGTIALYVAGKYEEMYIPEISEFVFICDDVFSKEDMFKMEKDILIRMDFELGGPLSLHFLRRYNKVAKVDIEHHSLGKYLIELALVDHRICHVAPSLQAAAACFLTLVTLGSRISSNGNCSNNTTTGSSTSLSSPPFNIAKYWTKTMVHYSSYSYAAITPHVHNLARLLCEAPNSKYQAVRTKYGSSDHRKISMKTALQSPIVKKLANMAKM